MISLLLIVLLIGPVQRSAHRITLSPGDGQQEPKQAGLSSLMQITSAAFRDGERIPTRYTCDGENLSPPLEWDNAPERTESFAIICEDPDAPGGTWVHWVLYALPANTTKLKESVPTTGVLRDGGRQGLNDFSSTGYGGPCPPRGRPHHYIFTLYAVDTRPELEQGASKEEVMSVLDGHILARATLVGIYRRG